MKDVLIIISVLVIILLGNYVSDSYTKKVTGELTASLEKLNSMLDDEKASREKVNQIIENWNAKNDVLTYYIEHDELEKLKTDLIAVKCNIETNQKEDAIEKIEIVKFVVNHIEDKYEVRLDNVF